MARLSREDLPPFATRFDELAVRYLATVRIAALPSGCPLTCSSNRL